MTIDTPATVRLRPTPITCALLAAVCLPGRSPVANGEIRFRHHYVDRASLSGTCWGITVLADLDNDQRPDVIVGRTKWGKGGMRGVYWYRNLGRADRWAARRTISSDTTCDCGGAAVDVDRDGWTDVVSGGLWYRNPGAKGHDNPWRAFPCNGVAGHDLEKADLDGDGRPELIAHLQKKPRGTVSIVRIPGDPRKPWPRTTIHTTRGEVHAAISPRGIGDLDGDKRPDIAFLGCWLANPGKDGPWKPRANLGFDRVGKWGQAVRCWVADIDRDGDNDIVFSECDMPAARVVWCENVRGDGSSWRTHQLPMDRPPGDFHSLAVADFDFDGDLDIYVDEMEHLHVPSSRRGRIGMIVWENVDGRGKTWRQQMVVTGLGGHQAQIADLDGDGDLDVVTRPYTARDNVNGGRMHVSVLENLARNPHTTGRWLGLASAKSRAAATSPAKPVQTSVAPSPRPTSPAPPGERQPAPPAADPEKRLAAHWTFDKKPGGVATFDKRKGHIDAGAPALTGSSAGLLPVLRAGDGIGIRTCCDCRTSVNARAVACLAEQMIARTGRWRL